MWISSQFKNNRWGCERGLLWASVEDATSQLISFIEENQSTQCRPLKVLLLPQPGRSRESQEGQGGTEQWLLTEAELMDRASAFDPMFHFLLKNPRPIGHRWPALSALSGHLNSLENFKNKWPGPTPEFPLQEDWGTTKNLHFSPVPRWCHENSCSTL